MNHINVKCCQKFRYYKRPRTTQIKTFSFQPKILKISSNENFTTIFYVKTAKETFSKQKKEILEEISVDEDGKAKKIDTVDDAPKTQKGEADGNV